MSPRTLSLYNFLGSVLSDQSLLPELRPDVGEAALDTELCGLDRAGSKLSMLNAVDHSRCLDRKPGWEKSKDTPLTLEPKQPYARGWALWVPSANLQHIFTGLQGVP